jgi:hypothetical protein
MLHGGFVDETGILFTVADIEKVKLIRHHVPNNYLKSFVTRSHELLEAKAGKKIVNSFIGGLMSLSKKKRFTTFTDNEHTTQAYRNLYKSKDLRTNYFVEPVDNSGESFIHYITDQLKTKNYHTSAPFWCQIIEDSIWSTHMMATWIVYKSPDAEILGYTVDAVIGRNVNKDRVQPANLNI